MSESYPRDMIGYGRTPPDPKWPDGAKLAVQFVVNYEEGGENNILHGDAASEAFLSEIVGAQPWPGHAPPEHGVDLRVRLPRRLLASVAHVHRAARIPVDRLRRDARAGAQPGGRRGDEGGRLGDRQPRPAVDRLQGFLGGRGAPHLRRRSASTPRSPARGRSASTRARRRSIRSRIAAGGGRLPLLLRHLRRRPALLDRRAARAASSSSPTRSTPTTCASPRRRASTPATSSSPISRTASTSSTPRAQAGAPKMMSVGLHCRLVGRPGRAAALARFLDYVQARDDVWLARRIDIAWHWHAHHKPARK